MNKIIFTGLALMVSMTAMAQQEMADDGSRVVLPLQAQACTLPSAPPPIAEAPVKADLLAAQKNVKGFQAEMAEYRACIDKDADSAELTWGNQQAILRAHDYSVEMEERVAAMFNEALRAYKASIATE
ncbi:MAG: hypothetical protein OEU84_08425 [Xanthomonadales bacterium]|jgi:hypothetical protein|nr:hypothetical protein [Xanthomonadales bacterium]MDH4019613.1 hypothetical protein [Xanthomonadales bacterium]